MSTTQETSVSSSQDHRCTEIEGQKNVVKKNGETKAESDKGKSTIEELFPWIIEFKKKCRCSLAQPNIVALIRLMKFYARNVSINVNECYTKPYRAAKLKDSISETLLFFLFYYRELVEVFNKNSYLDKMSDLLAMYMDMELKASRRGKEHHSKIAARLTSCLYVYLENSSEHILDTFIKARFINRNYHDILDPVLTKISKTIPPHPNCDMMFVRYLLTYRLWKKVNNDAAVKNQINATALLHLGPPPACPTPFLAKYVLPKVPKSQANSTKFLLLHKFDIEKSCRLFLQYCKENREDEDRIDLNKPNFTTNIPNSDSMEQLSGNGICRGTIHIDNLTNNVNIPDAEVNSVSESLPGKYMKFEKNVTNNEISTPKSIKPTKLSPKIKTKKTGDILFIDLTADETTEKVIKKKKTRKLHWLMEAKKKLNAKALRTMDKKKKAQTIPNSLIKDLTLPDLVDSTSAGTLSTVTTLDRSNFLESDSNDLTAARSLSITTSPEPENCVTSNFVENNSDLIVNTTNLNDEEISEFIETQPVCGVTTTVTEPTVIASNESQQTTFASITDTDESFTNKDTTTSCHMVNPPSSYVYQSLEDSSHTNHISDNVCSLKSDAWKVTELSNALSHICESYDSDNSALDTNGDNNMNISSKNVETMAETIAFECENMPVAHEEVVRTEIEQISEKSEVHGGLTENSEVAVVFVRRASDVDIVDLDEYAEDNIELLAKPHKEVQLEKTEEAVLLPVQLTTDKEHSRSESNESLQNNANDLPSTESGFNSEVQYLTLRTNELQLTSTSENLKQQSIINEDQTGKRNEITEEKKLSDKDTSKLIECKKIDLRNNDHRMIEIHQQNKLNTDDRQVIKNTLGKLEESELINYDIEKSCDYKSSRDDRLDDVKLQTSTTFQIAKKQCSSFENEEESRAEEKRMLPKINEIFICTKNVEDDVCNISSDLVENQEPQFGENIDGLSLLASVSQHVSHLKECSQKLPSKPKIINEKFSHAIKKIKNCSSFKNTLDDNSITPEVTTINSCELSSDLNTKTNNEIIKEVVEVPQQITNDNWIHGTGLKSKKYEKSNLDITKNDSLDVVPRILETTVDLNSSTVHNNLISVENVTQMIKDSTNVIVNGETVVLFQKSPNSNLYIINKANNGTMECSGNETSPKKNIKRNSTAMRDIMNHIPLNLSEKNKEGGKNHRTKTFFPNKNKLDNKKLDNSTKRYENQLISKQFQPIREKSSYHTDKLETEYIKKEILTGDNYEDILRQRCTDTPGSVIELEPVKKSPPPVIRLTDTPIDLQMQTSGKMNQESMTMDMTTTGRSNRKSQIKQREDKSKGIFNENLTYKQNIKQEFENCGDNSVDQISCCYSNPLTSDSQQVARQNIASINANNFSPINPINPSKIPHIYSTVTTATNLYSLEHGHCDYSSCNLKVSSSQSYQSISQSIPTCQLSHCACLKCSYDVHCGQYVQGSTAVAHSSYLQTNSYYLSSNPSVKTCLVEERESKLNEVALAKLHDDQLLQNIEQSIMDKTQLNQTNVKTEQEIKYKPDFDNKLPLKKRLKALAMLSMSYQEQPMKIEKVENYPGIPMMSIAALEARNIPQDTSPVSELKTTSTSTTLDSYPRVKDDSCHHSTEMIRRDYLKDTSLTSIGNCTNVDDRTRKSEQHRRQTINQVNVITPGCQKTFKTMAQRKEVIVSSPLSLKRTATSISNHPKSPKKVKKVKITTAKGRQTRSSKRNIPRVDYTQDFIIDTDPKWNASNELKRKRKKNSR